MMHRAPRSSGSVLCFLGLALGAAPPLAAQQPVFVVDASGGPGSQFTDLPAAVAAVPDGASLLVRPGNYSAFALSGKGLSIIGEDRDTVVIGSWPTFLSITIGGTAPTQSVLIRSATLAVASLSVVPGVTVQNARGPVLFDDVLFGHRLVFPGFSLGGSETVVANCANVQFHRCDLQGFQGPALHATDSVIQVSYSTIAGASETLCGFGKKAVELVRSRCEAVFSSITGGSSSHALVSLAGLCLGSGPGATGVDIRGNSKLIALNTTVAGGDGGTTTQFGSYYSTAFDGGDGIVASGGARVEVYGTPPLGGQPGGTGATAGAPFSTSTGAVVQVDPTASPSGGEIVGTMKRGSVIRFSLAATPGSLGILTIALQGTLIPLEPLTPGSLLFPPALTVGLFVVPPAGTLQYGFLLPPWWPLGETYYCQFLTAEPVTNRIWATNAFPIHVNQ